MRSLVGNTLQIEGAAEVLPASEEVLLITSSQFSVFESLTLGGGFYAETASAHQSNVANASFGVCAIYGRPFGFSLNLSATVPVWLEDNGAVQGWLFSLGFPWGVNLHVGAGYLFSLGDSLLPGITGGTHLMETQFYPPWNMKTNKVQQQFGGNPFYPFYMNGGVFGGFHILIRLTKSGFLLIGCDVAYDMLPWLADLIPSYFTLSGGWSITPTVTFALGK